MANSGGQKYLLLIISLVSYLLFLFLWIGVSFHLSFITQIDDTLIPLLQGGVTDSKTLFFTILTQLGGTIAMILFSLITVIIVWRKLGVRLAIWAGATFFTGELLIPQIFKHITLRQRPDDPLIPISGYSFPSGHAAGSTTFYGFLAILLLLFYLKKKSSKVVVPILFALFILLIMISRVYLSVHYPSDVIAGCLVGIGTITLSAFIYEHGFFRLKNRRL
ncbi:acid phosphatase [Listeria fleischmannii 1991]|uniref:Acid phosphatase n=1 Tax=Listeria fleischmannii 1991 TaxID=1430899 RepID=A0A0J8GF08_9LIST|nr:phosphatase PAP2 family protein [Listeria fleischmannii]EMG27773.1 acid phosphatase [Listeria fleischmannii subsp. fleischmannii LU2006-1]KMT59539.1 acid phosphatase [Listeria fleischmannii 1991]